MTTDNIIAVGIDKEGRLFIKPQTKRFTLVWRSATEVHWNDKEAYLYSPKPREWSYFDWYKHMVEVIAKNYNCKLLIVNDADWLNVPDELKSQILQFTNSEFQ